jgi:transcriptional regulator with XRE-family HTH domain
MPEIGATLREARMRARLDVSEIEAKTKIRAKYLRALENEEWSLLPGPTFVKSFLRTYAQALNLDGRALVEEYRLNHERPSEGALEPIVSTPRSSSRGRMPGAGPSRRYTIAVGAILAVIILLIVLLATSGGSGSKTGSQGAKGKRHLPPAVTHHAAATVPPVITLALRPSGVVYVCLLGDNGRRLIPGLELQPGETTPTYHARRFEITLGNSSVTMFVDGRPRSVPASNQAIGYSITKARGRQPLATAELPTCK